MSFLNWITGTAGYTAILAAFGLAVAAHFFAPRAWSALAWAIAFGVLGAAFVGQREITASVRIEAADMLLATLARYVDGIDRYAQVPLTQNQFDALVSWAYNVGLEGARTSTLMRKLNEGDYVGAADQLMRWNKAGGREVPGLTRRRAAERALFLTECEAPA